MHLMRVVFPAVGPDGSGPPVADDDVQILEDLPASAEAEIFDGDLYQYSFLLLKNR